ncbi:MAG: flagellin [Smithella sp.]
MAISDVSLTTGMKSNLLSLQNTVDLLDRTQTRLSTGKKVNSAIDNPVSYFASQSLTSRASIIDSLKDSMGQAVQTITAADKGISAITSLIEQAKGIAQSAQSADNTQNTVTLDLASVVATNTMGLGDSGYTLTCTASGASTVQFNKGATDTETAANIAAAINALSYTGTASYSATVEGEKITITKYLTASGGRETDAATADITGSATIITGADLNTATESELESLQSQYNTLRTQLTELAEDSGYKGKNLLSATSTSRSLTVQFEGTTLTVSGFNATSSGLGVTAAAWTTNDATQIDDDLDLLDDALTTLRKESSKMSGNLSIVTVRQDFSDNMINTLTEGADKLTLADTNEEGANMLMLQTRQSLGTTALSLSAQAAQSVLQLFR